MKALRNSLLASLAAALLCVPSTATATEFLTGAVSDFPTDWSVWTGTDTVTGPGIEGGNYARTNGVGALKRLNFDLGEDQSLTYTPDHGSDPGGTADVVISNAVFTTAYEKPGVDEVGGIDSQAAICVCTNGNDALQYYGWAGAYTTDGTTTNLTWFPLTGATPVEGATNTVTMSFNYTASPATVTFKVGNDVLEDENSVSAFSLSTSKTQVTAISFSGQGSIAELAGETAPGAASEYAVQFFDDDTTTSLFGPTNVPAGTAPAFLGTPNPPVKSNTAQYTYGFAGWTNAASGNAVVNLANETIVSVTNYYATYTATPVFYTLTWNLDGGEITSAAGTYTAAGSVAYGTVLTAPTVTKTGYAFDAWDPAVSTMPAANTAYTATWTPRTDTAYMVKHFQQALDGTYPSTPTDTDELTGTTGGQTAAAPKSYTGFTVGTVTQTTIAADGSTVVTIQYSRNSYTLTWNLDGGEITSEAGTYTAAGSVAYGTALRAPAVANTGYTFNGWDSEVASTMPAANTTYTATWTEIVVPTLALAKPTIASTVLASGTAGATVKVTVDPAAVVTATNANVAFTSEGAVTNATFTSLPWNDPVDWMLQSEGAENLPGRFYAKGETEWFNVATNGLDDITDLAEGMKGVDMSETPSATNQMVRIQTCLEI